MTRILAELAGLLESRKNADPDQSYVADLYRKGLDRILQKVGEEAVEVVLAAKNFEQEEGAMQRSALIGEFADLWFHTLVTMSHCGVSHEEVLAELERRSGLSGHAEKAARGGS